MTDELDRLVQEVLRSRNYRSVSDDLVRDIGARELEHRRSLKEAVKATKNKLHQIGGAYLDRGTDYERWLKKLKDAASEDPQAFRAACRRIMGYHASTRERLPILDRFYAEILGSLPPIDSVLDIACGLNPLAIPWMPLSPGATYLACDMYTDLVEFLNGFFSIAEVNGRAIACDIVRAVPQEKVDVAFILKTIPCLDQLDKTAAFRLLDSVNADHLFISFPVRSLCGKVKGMAANYDARFLELTAVRDWEVRRFEFETELAFLIRR